MCVPLPAGILTVTFIFPLSGWALEPLLVTGAYWSSTAYSLQPGQTLLLAGASAGPSTADLVSSVSVRCVRAREEQAIPCFFPLSGSEGDSSVLGTYWTDVAGRRQLMVVLASRAYITDASDGYCVRCVRAREGQAIPCFFPLSGAAGGLSDVSGSYWTGTRPYPDYGYPLSVTPVHAVVVSYVAVASGYSVRCVRAREGQALPCFFPLAGSAGSESDVLGTYWATGDEDFWHNRCVLQSTSGSCVVGWVQPTTYSVRCVRAREEQAIPLFWIWFWSSLIYEGLAGVRGILVGASERVWPVQ